MNKCWVEESKFLFLRAGPEFLKRDDIQIHKIRPFTQTAITADAALKKAMSRLCLRKLWSFCAPNKMLVIFHQSLMVNAVCCNVVCCRSIICARDSSRLNKPIHEAKSIIVQNLETFVSARKRTSPSCPVHPSPSMPHNRDSQAHSPTNSFNSTVAKIDLGNNFYNSTPHCKATPLCDRWRHRYK